MAHVVSGKLRKAPFVKPGCGQDGQSTMYGIELAEVNKHYQTGEKSYTNYRVIFFAKTQAANEFYAKAFAEGSFVTVACEKLKVNVSDCGQYIKLDMENPRLEGCLPAAEQGSQTQQQGSWGQPQQPQQQQNRAPQQQAPQQAQPQYNEPPMDFSDDIPFAPIGLMHNNNLMHCI